MATQRKDPDLLTGLIAMVQSAMHDNKNEDFFDPPFHPSDFETILGGCIDFDPALPGIERSRIITKVAAEATKAKNASPKKILGACSKLENEYLLKPKVTYRLLTEISLSQEISVPRSIINGVTLSFNAKMDKAFSARAVHALDSKYLTNFEIPSKYMRLTATLSARSPSEAAARALDSIDLLRATWNLSLNRNKLTRRSGGTPSPVNDIRLSPFHTVHDVRGALATEMYWYEPGYRKPAKNFSDKAKFGNLNRFAANLRRELAKSLYREDLEGALIRYVRALDAADLNDAFLRLWGLLEYLTNCISEPNKIVIRRASFLHIDSDRERLILTHLASCRNKYVHAGSEVSEIEHLLFHLKRHVDTILIFHLAHNFRFSSREEAAKFMDHPTSAEELFRRRDELQNQNKRLNQVLKFLSV